MLFNQPSSLDEVVANGITPENTGIQSKDYYKNIDAVQQAFTKDDGKFDEVSFENFYNSAVKTYNKFSEEDWTRKLIKEMDKDPFDWTQPLNTNVKDVSVTIQNGNNPERRSMSITGIGSIGSPTFSIREIAQDNEIRDENGNGLGWTPNQKGAVGSLFEPTVVLAQWDEDGEHMYNGRKVFHKKGDYKIDEKGDFYYEILGNREAYDKEILRFSDVLTIDGTTLNKFDVFDSDSLHKNAASVVAKTALEVLPLLTPFGQVYGTISAITNLASVLPTLGKSINGIVSGTNENEIGQMLTKMENWFGRFDETSTDYAKEHFASLENIGNILTSSAKQLYQQRSLANLTKLINKNSTLSSSNLGKHISLGYLALTSSEEVYGDFKRAGASDAVAGLGMLASSAALYELMNLEYFRNHLFKGTFMDESEAVDVIKNLNRDEISKIGAAIAKNPSKQEAVGMFNELKDGIKKNLKKFMESPYSGKAQGLLTGSQKAWNVAEKFANRAINEGLEETVEEIAFDAVKGIFSAMDALGIPVTEDENSRLNFGFSLEDNLTRYLTSFVGGALGGAVFQGIDMYEHIGSKMIDLSSKSAIDQATYMIITGRANELKDRAKVLYDKGMLGDKNLSARKTVNVEDQTYFTQGDENDNQNLANYNAIIQYINTLETILMDHRISTALQYDIFDVDDNGIPKHLTKEFEGEIKKQKDKEKSEKIDSAEYTHRYKENALTQTVSKLKLNSTYINELVDLGSKIAKTEATLRKLRGLSKDSDPEKTSEQIKFYENLLKQYDEQRDELMEGGRTDKYVQQVLFTTSPAMRDVFMSTEIKGLDKNLQGSYWAGSKEGYVKIRYGKNWDNLTKTEQDHYEEEYKQYMATTGIDQLIQASRIQYDFLERTSQSIKDTEELLKDKSLDNYHNHGHLSLHSSDYEKYEQSMTRLEEIADEADELQRQEQELRNKWEGTEPFETSEDYEKLTDMAFELQKEQLEIQMFLNSFEGLYGSGVEGKADGFQKGALTEAMTEEGREKLHLPLLEKRQNVKYWSNLKSLYIKRNQLFKTLLDTLDNLRETGIINFSGKTKDFTFGDVQTILENLNIDSMVELDEYTAQELVDNRAKFMLYNNELRAETLDSITAQTTVAINELLDHIKTYYTKIKDESVIIENDLILKKGLAQVTSLILPIDFSSSSIINNLNVPEDSESSETLPKTLIKKVTDFYTKLSNGEVAEAYSVYQSAVSDVRDAYTTYEVEDDPEQYVKDLVNEFSLGVDIIQFLQDIEAIKQSIDTFSIIDLLRGAEVNVDGTTLKLISILEEQENSFLKALDVDNYIISNPVHKVGLKNGIKLIRTLLSTVHSAYVGQNAIINVYRKKAGKEELPEIISESTKDIIFSDGSYLVSKMADLLELSEMTAANKKDFHRKSELKIKTDFVKNLLFNADEQDSFIRRLSTRFFGDDDERLYSKIKELLEKHKINIDKVDFDNFKEFNKFFIELGDLLYDEIRNSVSANSKTEIDEIIGEKLAEVLPTDAYLQLTGQITDRSEPEFKLTDLSTVIMIAGLLGNKSTKFYSNLKAVQAATPEIVPIIGQEWNIQLGIALVESTGIFNKLVHGIQASVNNENVKLDGNARSYMLDRPILENFIFIQGGAGSGKTSVVAKMIAEISKVNYPDIEIVTAGPEITQVKSIQNSIDSKKSFTFIDLMAKIAPDWDTWTVPEGTHFKLEDDFIKTKVTSKADVIFKKTSPKKMIILDEITFLSERELQILSYWASVNNIILVGLGDRKQNRKREVTKDKKVWRSGIEDCIYVSGPELTSSIRNNNIAKQLNLEKLTVLLNNVLAEYKQKPWLSLDQLDTILKNHVKANSVPTRIVWYEEKGKSFVGEKFIEEKDMMEYVDEFVTLSTNLRKELKDEDERKPKVLLITDKADKYLALEEKGVTVMNSNKAQGGEYDYVIIDKTFSKESTFEALQDLYTSISRSRIGTVIVGNKKLQDDFNLLNTEADPSIKDKPVSFVDDSKSLKEWKNGLLDFIDATSEAEKTNDEKEGEETEGEGNDDSQDPEAAPSSVEVISSEFDGGEVGTIDTNLNRAEREAAAKSKDQKAIEDAINPSKTSNKQIETHIKKKIAGKSTFSRKAFVEELHKNYDFSEARLFQLFSSAVMFNLDIEEHHIAKIVRESSTLSKRKIEKLAKQWNEEDIHDYKAMYDPSTDTSTIIYEFENIKFPIAYIKGRVEGELSLKRSIPLFKQVTRPIRIVSDGSVPINESISYGSVYSKGRIFAPKNTADFGRKGVTSGHWSVHENNTFRYGVGDPNSTDPNARKYRKGAVGKTYTVWSECELLTDQDFEKMFKHHEHEGTYDGYVDVQEMVTEANIGGKDNVVYDLKNGAQAIMFGVQRRTSLSEIYDIVCIARFAAGRINFAKLTTAQKELLGNRNDRDVAESIVRGVIGNFAVNKLIGTDVSINKEIWRENLKNLKTTYRLLSSNSSEKLMGALYQCFTEIGNEKWMSGFTENIFKLLRKGAVKSKSTDSIVQPGLKIKIGNKHYIAKFDEEGFYDVYEFDKRKAELGTKIGSVKTSGINLKLFELAQVIKGDLTPEEFNNQVKKQKIEFAILKISTKKEGEVTNTWYDMADDYDYIFGLLNGIGGLDLSILDEHLPNTYFKNGMYLNDAGGNYQVGSDENSNDETKTTWRVHDTVKTSNRCASIAGFVSSNFELDHEFNVPVETSESVIEELIETQTTDEIISEFKEKIVSLLEQHEEVDDEMVSELFEKYKDETDITVMVIKVLDEINSQTIKKDAILIDGDIKLAEKQKKASVEPVIDSEVEQPGTILNYEVEDSIKTAIFDGDDIDHMTLTITGDDPNVEDVVIPVEYVNKVKTALASLNPEWGIIRDYKTWSAYIFKNSALIDPDTYDLLEAIYDAIENMSFCI